MIRETNFDEILEFAKEYFPNIKMNENPFEKIYAYFLDDKVIGFISVSVIYDRCEIDYFVVSEEYRGKGVAQKLLDYLILNLNGNNLTLEVSCNNDRAIGFYLKNGFKKVSVRKKYYNGVDGYLMIKEL